MDDIKVSLTITLPGRVMKKEDECTKKDYIYNSVLVRDPKTHKKETLHYFTRGCKNARQSIKMSKESYSSMIAKDECPEWEKKAKWVKMKKDQRLESHLQRVMEALGGLSFSYEVFDD